MPPSDPANLSHLQLCGWLALTLTSSPVARHKFTAHVSPVAVPRERARAPESGQSWVLGKDGLEEGKKRSAMGPRLTAPCGPNARLGRGALRGWTRPSYCLSLGSRRSFSIGKSLSGTMKQLSRLHPLRTSIHQSLTLSSKEEGQDTCINLQ